MSDPQDERLIQTMHTYYEKRAPEYDDWWERRGRYDDPATNAAWHAATAALAERVERFAVGLSSAAAPGAAAPLPRALEIACGTGRWTAMLAAQAGVTAVDYSPAMLDQARQRVQAAGLESRVSWVQADAYTLPFPPHSFDGCLFGFWISHVPEARRAAFFEQIGRLVRPGGRVLLFDQLWRPEEHAEREVQQRALRDGSRHAVLKIYFTPESLREVLTPFARDVDAWAVDRQFVGAAYTVP